MPKHARSAHAHFRMDIPHDVDIRDKFSPALRGGSLPGGSVVQFRPTALPSDAAQNGSLVVAPGAGNAQSSATFTYPPGLASAINHDTDDDISERNAAELRILKE